MEKGNLGYPEVLKFIADFAGIILDNTPPPKPAKKPKSAPLPKPETFCSRMLAASGLEEKDIMALVKSDTDTTVERPAFIRGTRDEYGRLLEHRDDDVIIRYYDLRGREVTFRKEKSSHDIPFRRIRRQFPEQHLDREGKPFRYFSPTGSGTHIYYPQTVRTLS